MENCNFVADKKILDLIKELRQIREEVKCLQEREKKIKDDIAEIVGESDAICNEEGTVLATYKYQERTTFDTRMLKDEAPEIYKFYCKPIIVRNFLLKG